MNELLASGVGILGTIAILVLQYYLVKRPQKWMPFVLPAICFALSVKNVVDVVQSGEVILDGVAGTAVLVFAAGNMMTIMLLAIWWKRDADIRSIGFTVLGIYLICNIVFALVSYAAMINYFVTDEEVNPSPNVGMRYYDVTEEDYANYPVMLEDLGAEVMPYRYTNTSTMVMPNYSESEYVDSMVDDIENTTKILTIEYEIRVADAKELDSREKTLQKRSDEEPIVTKLDYGAESSYWLGDNLLLRYDDCLVYFKDSSSRDMLDSETAAEFFRTDFVLEQK